MRHISNLGIYRINYLRQEKCNIFWKIRCGSRWVFNIWPPSPKQLEVFFNLEGRLNLKF